MHNISWPLTWIFRNCTEIPYVEGGRKQYIWYTYQSSSIAGEDYYGLSFFIATWSYTCITMVICDEQIARLVKCQEIWII